MKSMHLLVFWDSSLVCTVDVFCVLFFGIYCIFVKHFLQIFAYVECNMFVKSISMFLQIFSNHVVVCCKTHWLVFFGKKLKRKSVFDMSVYHLASQSLLRCPNFFRCFRQFGFELKLFWLSFQSHCCQFIILLRLGDYTPYFQTDFVKVLCFWFWEDWAYNFLFNSMHLLLHF